MADDMYELFALIPADSDFTLEKAVAHFRAAHFRGVGLQGEFVNASNSGAGVGFRVRYGDWAVVAWVIE